MLQELLEGVGRSLGALARPVTAAGARVRHARLLHPDGVALLARVEPAALLEPELAALGARLQGLAVVRLSGALWRGRRRHLPDVLGVAVRFTWARAPTERPREGDQDVLFATVRSPWTLGLAPLTTRVGDFLQNHYFAVSPFRAAGVAGRLKLRLVPSGAVERGGDRVERLLAAVAAGSAGFTLEVRPDGAAGAPWQPVVRLRLLEQVQLDPRQLRFDPFRDGRGIRPVGFIHALRPGAYGGSQEERARVGPAPVDPETGRRRRLH